MFGSKPPRNARRSLGNSEQQSSLREALRARGGARAPSGPAPTDVEDNEPREKAHLDWLNLTAFAPKALQSAIERIRAGDALPAALLRANSKEVQGSSPDPPSADTAPARQEIKGRASLSGGLVGPSDLRSALQARGGLGRRSMTANIFETGAAEVGEDSGSYPGTSSDSASAPAAADAAAAGGADLGDDVACAAAECSGTEAAPLAVLLPALAEGDEQEQQPGKELAEAGTSQPQCQGAARQREADHVVRLTPRLDEPPPSREHRLSAVAAAVAAAEKALPPKLVAPRSEERPPVEGPAPMPRLAPEPPQLRRADKAGAEVGKLKELREFWGAKTSIGFAGPQLGDTRLSKVEAQATLQRLIAAGGAVDFDEVRRLRRLVSEID